MPAQASKILLPPQLLLYSASQIKLNTKLPTRQTPSDALTGAYSGPNIDSLEKFMCKAYPSGPRNTAEYAVFGADKIVQYSNRSHLWPVTFGLACFAVEMMHAAAAIYDFHRFNMIFPALVNKIAEVYDQMPHTKYFVSMGSVLMVVVVIMLSIYLSQNRI